MVVNLTVPTAHAEVGRAALEAGKHVDSEKPLAMEREDGRALLDRAREAGLRVGCAPDTFLGGGLQTCRKLVDDGAIGDVIGVSALFATRGLENRHPNSEFFFKPGGGPLLDMGPYYLTALVSLLGPVAFLLEFESGASGTMLTSFDVWYSELPRIELYGSDGTLIVPDPNTFGGPVRLKRVGRDVEDVPLAFPHTENHRGIGVADMAHALRTERPHRASGDLGYHVLDTLITIFEAAREGRRLDVKSRAARPEPLPPGLAEGELDVRD